MQGSKFHDPAYDYIPDSQFRALTVVLVGATLATAVLVPNIEVVLGLTGSTIGTLICIILPGMLFSRVITKSTNERLLAQVIRQLKLLVETGTAVTFQDCLSSILRSVVILFHFIFISFIFLKDIVKDQAQFQPKCSASKNKKEKRRTKWLVFGYGCTVLIGFDTIFVLYSHHSSGTLR